MQPCQDHEGVYAGATLVTWRRVSNVDNIVLGVAFLLEMVFELRAATDLDGPERVRLNTSL